jgi:hypothetical protein
LYEDEKEEHESMGWLDKAKELRGNRVDRLMLELDRERQKEDARAKAAESAIKPALGLYAKIAEEFCSQSGWRMGSGWAGPSNHKSLSIQSSSWSKSYMGVSSHVCNSGDIIVSFPPLKTTVHARRPSESRSSFVREFSGISVESLKRALEELYLWQ